MESRQEKSIIKRFYKSRLFLVIILFVSIFMILDYSRAYYQDYKIKQEIKSLEEEFARLQKNKLESLDLLEYVSDSDFVEEKAREELNLKKPGENVLIIKREDPADTGSYQEQSEEKKSNPKRWLNYFLKNSVDN